MVPEKGVEKHMEKLTTIVRILEPSFEIDSCECGCTDCECANRKLGASEGLNLAGEILRATAEIDKKYEGCG